MIMMATYNYRRVSLRFALGLLLLMFLTGCGGSGVPATPGERPTPTPLPDAPAWRTAAQPITLSNIQNLSLLGRLEGPGSPSTFFAYALSPDNTRLAALNNEFTVAWDLVTGKLVFATSRADATRIYYSPDKDRIYAIATDGSIYYINSEDGTYETTIGAIDAYNNVAEYIPAEGLLAIASTSGDINIWNLPDQTGLVTLPGSGSQAVGLAFSPDSTRLAVVYDEGIVLIWDWREQTVATVPVAPDETVGKIEQVRFSSDGQYLAGSTFSTAVIWNAQDGTLMHTLSLKNGGGSSVFKFSPQNAYLLTGGLPSDAALWNIVTGQLAAALPGVGSETIDASFSPAGDLLFTSRLGDEVVLWNLANLANGTIARSSQPIANEYIVNVLWTDDAFQVLLIDSRGPVEIWGIP
jgi:WD40 repeat protein